MGPLKARHDAFLNAVLDGFAAAGCAIDRSEIWISRHDGKRVDGAIYHTALGGRGVAVDATIWNDLTLGRLPLSAVVSHWVLAAAEVSKVKKYRDLCEAANFDFAALAPRQRSLPRGM